MPKKTNTNNNEYQQLVESLKKKYGVIATPYFLDEQLTIKNTKITRGKEGLFIHHIKEDKWIMLANREANFKFKVPYSVHLGGNLVYCNYLEHLRLHLLIYQNPLTWTALCKCGIGGIINFICREINDWIYHNNMKAYEGSQTWRNKTMECIRDNMDEYIGILQETYKTMKANKEKLEEISKLWRKSVFFGAQEIPELKKKIIA